MRIDFSELKGRISIEDVAQVLLPDIKESNGAVKQYRASCPQCKAGGDRALAVTPGKGYYCNADKRGGDQIALVSHVQGVSMRQAAEWLVERFHLASPAPQTPPPQESKAPPPTVEPEEGDGLKPLKNLDAAHEAVKALKMPQEVAVALGAGYCSKGLLRGLVAFPLRTNTGKLVGYVGVKDGKLPEKWEALK